MTDHDDELSRRQLLVLGAATSLLSCAGSKLETTDTATRLMGPERESMLNLTLHVNGAKHSLSLDARTTLLDALREKLKLTGTKKGCDMGQCGACTVLVDDVRVNACLTLAAQTEGRHITTIEGLSPSPGSLHPVQQAFLDEDAFQCGYCTPGQILSCVGLLREGKATSDDEIREGMSGNLCRCGAYPNILAAVKRAQGRS